MTLRTQIKVFYLLLGSLFFTPLLAQIEVTGKVIDPKNEAIPGVTILLMSAKDSLVLQHALTNELGHYKLSYNGEEKRLVVALTGFNLEPQHKPIEFKSQVINFTAREKVIVLQEVVVKSQRIWGARDTVNYLVSSFKESSDLIIEDVLKRLPGVDVSKNGLISYQGKPINRFYIENMDLLQGKYTLGTKNISVEDISTVQILENHQPIKALEDVEYSDQAAINLKIRDEKKGLYGLILSLGAGYSNKVLWNSEAILTYFSKKRQHLISYKSNNNGRNILGQLNKFNSRPLIYSLRSTNIHQPSVPPIDIERYLDNKSHVLTVNNAFKPTQSSEVNANIAYSYNEDQRRGAVKTTYLFPDRSPLIVEEISNSQEYAHSLSGQLRYEVNEKNNYFNNLLSFVGDWSNIIGKTINSDLEVAQRLGDQRLYLQNTTNWIKKNSRGKGIQLRSSNAFSTQPHYLKVAPGVFPTLINEGLNYELLMQKFDRRVFISNNNITLLSLLVMGNIRISPNIFINMVNQELKSNFFLKDKELSTPRFVNDVRYTYADAGAQFIFSYKVHPFDLQFVLPFCYGYRKLNNKNELQEVQYSSRFYILPYFQGKINLPKGLILKTGASLQNSEPSLGQMLSGFVLDDYRRISANSPELYCNKVIYTNLGLEYKNLYNLFFATLSTSFSQSQNKMITTQRFENDYSIFEIKRYPHKNNSYGLSGTIGKNFEWSDLLIQFNGFLRKNEPKYVRDDVLVDYLQTSCGIGGKIELTPLRHLLISNEVFYTNNYGRAKGIQESNRYSTLSNHLSLDAEITKSLRVSAIYDYYLTDDSMSKNHMSLADIGLSYTVNNINLDLKVTNLFNVDRYRNIKINDLTTYATEYWIRPRAIMLQVRFKVF